MEVLIGNKKRGDTGEYIGRPSPLGNPYRIGEDGTREQVIKLYRKWLKEKIRTADVPVCAELLRLKTILLATGKVTLVCWCWPLPCHGAVIREVLLRSIT